MRSEAGTLLLESGIIDENQLQRVLSSSVAGGQTFVQALIGLGYMDDKELAAFFSSKLQIPLAEKSLFLRLPTFITRLVPIDIVMTHRTVPVMLHQGVLHMAMSDPTNREALEEISFVTGYNASPVATPDRLLEQAMEEYYGILPDRGQTQVNYVPAVDEGGLSSDFPIFSTLVRNPSGSHFEESPELIAEAPSTPNVTELSPAGPKKSDQATLLIEPASGELEELFGLGSRDQEIIHLTKTKKSTISSINDAIVKKVESVLDQAKSEETRPKTNPIGNVIETNIKPPASQQEPENQLTALNDSAKAKYLVDNAKDRDEIARTLVQFSSSLMERVVIFIIKKDMLVGWMGTGSKVKKDQIKGIIIPLSSPSVFRTVKETQTDYFGSMPRTSANEMFLATLGEVRPRQVLLIPITVRQKAICILYGDCGKRPGFRKDLSSIHLLALDASAAFERLILEKKINRLVKK